MNRQPRSGAKIFLAAAVLAIAFFSNRSAYAQNAKKPGVEQELIRTETGFFEAWKTKDLAYFRDHIPANGVSWGKNGTFSREEQLQEQMNLAKDCTVDGYGLSDFSMVELGTATYLLTYTAEQYATCHGEKLPVHLNGSSVYVSKDGRWQAAYRAQVPLDNQR